MRWRARSLIAVGLGLLWSSPAHACSIWFNSTFLMIPSGPTVSLGLQNVDDYMIIVADAAFNVGDKLVLRPGVGSCRYTGEGGGSETIYGAAAGMNVWKDASGKVAVNAQAGAEMMSSEGYTLRNIPVGAAVQYMTSEMLSLFAGAAINLWSETGPDDYSDSSTDPSIYAGVAFKTGKINLTGGFTMYMYDGGNETAINIGAGMGLGSASNALKNIGSLFRK